MATAVDLSKKYTYADYLTWSDDERWELIGGIPYNMSPAPNRRHQKILLKLGRHVAEFFDDSTCEVYLAPFDVRLSEDYSDDHLIENVVQPDLTVFCKMERLDEKGAVGAPDLVVEILSPTTARKDMKEKMLLYQKFAVREYWLVDPELNQIEVMVLDVQGRFQLKNTFVENQDFNSFIFPKLALNLSKLFEP
jgi:Uma2 family endonuclease